MQTATVQGQAKIR